jgi:subtilase family serine protease
MRPRQLMAALAPVGAASALAVLPVGPSVAASTSAVAASAAAAAGVAANEGTFYLFGGTSAGSPRWAAITALADQQDHRPLGYLNNDLYALARGPLYGYVFHDITTGNNTVSLTHSNGNAVNITGYPATRGWDPVTGLGTPNVAHLLQFLR